MLSLAFLSKDCILLILSNSCFAVLMHKCSNSKRYFFKTCDFVLFQLFPILLEVVEVAEIVVVVVIGVVAVVIVVVIWKHIKVCLNLNLLIYFLLFLCLFIIAWHGMNLVGITLQGIFKCILMFLIMFISWGVIIKAFMPCSLTLILDWLYILVYNMISLGSWLNEIIQCLTDLNCDQLSDCSKLFNLFSIIFNGHQIYLN